jgi:Cof subfamily protein (haloacid dehalogenase superfamily)
MINKDFLKKIKLVVFDLDGTLVDDNDKIGEETVLLIKELSKLGVIFSIATGRVLTAVTDHADSIGITAPLITLDGSLIQRYPGQQSIYQSYVSPRYVARALKLADQFLLNAALCHDTAVYYTEENSIIPTIADKFGAKFQKINSYKNYLDETLEIIIVGDYQKNIRHVASKMSFPYTFGIRSSFYKSESKGGTYFLEIRKFGANKGEGLKILTRHLKIKIKETAVFGDWYNDKPLFENDALKIAIANAVPELKKMADIITKRTNNEEGVAEFLKILLQAKKS